jgi:hypothetical protein
MFRSLRVRHLETRVVGPPNRRLLADVEITNPSDVDGVILGASVEVRFEPGGTVVGTSFEQLHAISRRAILASKGRVLGRFVVPVTAETLSEIERYRTDRVGVVVSGRLLVAPVVVSRFKGPDADRGTSGLSSEGEPVLGAPFETIAGDETGSAMLGLTIAASEWIKHLRTWRWQEVELFQIGLSARMQPSEFARVYDNLRMAEQSFLGQDWDATLSHSRRALESLAKAAGGGDVKTGYEELSAGKFGGPIMTGHFLALVKGLTDFAHAGRHESLPHEPVTRDDAHLVLRTTLAVVERLTR